MNGTLREEYTWWFYCKELGDDSVNSIMVLINIADSYYRFLVSSTESDPVVLKNYISFKLSPTWLPRTVTLIEIVRLKLVI